MKNIFFLTIIILSLSCKKEPDSKGIFEDHWAIRDTTKTPSIDLYPLKVSFSVFITKDSKNSNQIIINVDSVTHSQLLHSNSNQIAIVNGLTYTYRNFNLTEKYKGKYVSVAYTGTGTLTSDFNTINESGSMTFNYDDSTYSVIWTRKLGRFLPVKGSGGLTFMNIFIMHF
jgi:hypothetical protein